MQVSFVGPSTWFTSDWQNMLCNELSKTRLLAKRGIAILKTPRWSTSVAQVGHLDRVAGEHWLAIGDAAVTWSPLAGQGIYRSLESVMIATESIIANSNGEKDALSYYAAHTRSRIQQLIYQWESIHTAVA
jgi:2-polyprenyl-6-methoxyphenol hydroxylase-like FAD-dependent oxidoreductase